jgi:excisionase family DNA binding protein
MYCTIKEAATMLSVSDKTIRRMIKRNTIPSYSIPGTRAVRLVKDDLRLMPNVICGKNAIFPKSSHTHSNRRAVWED